MSILLFVHWRHFLKKICLNEFRIKRRRPRYARASSRSSRTRSRGCEIWLRGPLRPLRGSTCGLGQPDAFGAGTSPYGSQPPTRGGYGVSLNAQLIHRVFSQRLSRTLPSVSVRGPPRRVSRTPASASASRTAYGWGILSLQRQSSLD